MRKAGLLMPVSALPSDYGVGDFGKGSREFIDIIRKVYESGVDIFMIEHNMDVVMKISDYITVLSFGRMIAEGTPKEVQSNEEVIRAYLGSRYVEQDSR